MRVSEPTHNWAGYIEGEDAAVLLSDLRGFTALVDRLPADEVIAHLNDCFEVVTTQVQKHGDEVLKFIGDGMLAVFNVDESSRGTACCQAVHAAIGAVRAIAALNRKRAVPHSLSMISIMWVLYRTQTDAQDAFVPKLDTTNLFANP